MGTSSPRTECDGYRRQDVRSSVLSQNHPMDKPITPKQLAKELGVAPRTIRQWLRDQGWQSVPYSRWELSRDQAEQVRTRFRRGGENG